ncbi:UPAR/Ly6 domain-containing protein qvr-like isoform X2 [Babylonia areolata]|uniref:UPAR/Ly6 domain-containing protein qvr-like isoform X2 n=1 Tax=Babylonia areolata TaxID=304850 RepID=UPI003FD209FB
MKLWVWRTLAQQLPDVDAQTTEIPCRSASDSYSCYHCKTNTHHVDNYCGDPFNTSHPQLDAVQCSLNDYCAKWVVQLPSGALQTTRTCSSNMQLNLKIYLVCMTESGSDEGHLCFCEGELCNSAPSLSAQTSFPIYVTFGLALVGTFRGGLSLVGIL